MKADTLESMKIRYRIKFPPSSSVRLEQDEVFFSLVENGEARSFRFHDYAEIYKRPDLYEQIFYDRLKCNSPGKVADLLKRALNTVREPLNELRVLDLGAGNGMMGEVLKREGVARLVARISSRRLAMLLTAIDLKSTTTTASLTLEI